jgi:thiamine kinase-like enzyme
MGRIEEFINCDPINHEEFRNDIQSFACILRKLHQVKITDHTIYDKQVPDFFNYINQWEQVVLGLKMESNELTKNFEQIYQSGQKVKNNLIQICSQLGIEKTICHNDFQQLNLLVDKSNQKYLIDWEYSSLNYPYYDIANYFAECALNNTNLTRDENYYPSKEQRLNFYVNYFDEIPKDNFEQIDHVIGLFAQLVEYVWFIWSIIKFSNSNSLDYLTYGLIRKNTFIKLLGQ